MATGLRGWTGGGPDPQTAVLVQVIARHIDQLGKLDTGLTRMAMREGVSESARAFKVNDKDHNKDVASHLGVADGVSRWGFLNGGC